MISWNDIGGLQVVSKLDEILKKWFGVELFYSDASNKIRSKHLQKDHAFGNHFFKVQMLLPGGQGILIEDVEKVSASWEQVKGNLFVYKSFYPHVYGVAAKVVVDAEVSGMVFAYPFLMENCSTSELSEIKQKLVETGANKEDAERALTTIKRMSPKDIEYLSEMVGIVSEEIVTYHTEITKREDRIHDLNNELGEKYRYHAMIGKSKKMQQIYSLLEKLSSSDSSVLIQGENGTGKELVAKAIHYYSPKRDNVFLAVNCSAFNDNLLDSELFGHVKGAFTGAIKDKKGFFEQADGGTLFLDEIGDTSLTMQVKLLRVLQEGTFLPVGSTTSRKSDVRIICATNRNLKEMMEKGTFREDLYYRINVINVRLPPLRERPEDIPVLIEHFLQKRCAEAGKPIKQLGKRCLEKFLDYPWPGNVRELENEIERLVVLAGDEKMITDELLSARILEHGERHEANTGINTQGSLKDAMEELERLMIQEGLKKCNYNRSRLSRELGISRANLIAKIERYGLDKRKKAIGE